MERQQPHRMDCCVTAVFDNLQQRMAQQQPHRVDWPHPVKQRLHQLHQRMDKQRIITRISGPHPDHDRRCGNLQRHNRY